MKYRKWNLVDWAYVVSITMLTALPFISGMALAYIAAHFIVKYW